jgi:hypothetical protein
MDDDELMQQIEMVRQMQDEDMRHTEELRKDLFAANDVYITALSRVNEARAALTAAKDKYTAAYAAFLPRGKK